MMSAEINGAEPSTACDRPEVRGSWWPAERRGSAAEDRWSGFARQKAVALAAPPGARHPACREGRSESTAHAGVPADRGRVSERKGALRVPRHALLGAGEPHPPDRRGGGPRLVGARDEGARGADCARREPGLGT